LPAFPIEAIKYCLNQSGRSLNDLDAIVFYDKPLLKFERLLETYYVNAPKGWKSFLTAMPVWIKEKLFLKGLILKELDKIAGQKIERSKLLFSEHHLSHAASAFYPSPFESAAILTLDAIGEWTTASIGFGQGNKVELKKELHFPHSLGLLYSACTYFLGFKVNSGEYKLMGLAPYGNPSSPKIREYKDLIYKYLIDVKEDGSLWLNQEFFSYSSDVKMVDDAKWEKLFGFRKRQAESQLEQEHGNLALAIQQVTEDIVLKMAKTAKKITGADYLCLAGGVALNCVANSKILKSEIFKDIWIQPAAGDAGGALGAALAVYHIYFAGQRQVNKNDNMQGSYLGPEYSDIDIEKVAAKFRATFKKISNFDEVCQTVAQLIEDGKIIGWFQGRMEWGPRALGNRSIIGDARKKDMQKRMNLKIKYRESFRPFAPSIMVEAVPDFFDDNHISPYMLFINWIKQEKRQVLPENFGQLSLNEKLYFSRSDVPAITHLDYSARLQTVHQDTNPKYWQLINTFRQMTGYGIIVNTSFNVRGEPIVCNPADAFQCFMNTEMDYLVMNNYIFDKREQIAVSKKEEALNKYSLD